MRQGELIIYAGIPGHLETDCDGSGHTYVVPIQRTHSVINTDQAVPLSCRKKSPARNGASGVIVFHANHHGERIIIQHRRKTLRLMLHYRPGDSNLIAAVAKSTIVTIQRFTPARDMTRLYNSCLTNPAAADNKNHGKIR